MPTKCFAVDVLRFAFAAGALAGLGGCLSEKGERRTVHIFAGGIDDRELRYISPREADEKIRESWEKGEAMSLIVIDTRPEEQWRQSRIAGARNLQLRDIREGTLQVPVWDRADLTRAKAANATETRSNRLGDYDDIIVYGADPSSATPLAMAKRLRSLSYRDVFVLDGGLHAWRAAGGEVVGMGDSTEAVKQE